VILAAAVAVALAAPSRRELTDRWLRANKTHVVANLRAVPHVPANLPTTDLNALAQRELATPGRYHFAARTMPSKAWWWRILQWLGERWQSLKRALFGRLHLGKETAAGIGDALLAIVALVLLVTIVRLARNVQIARASSARTRDEPLRDAPSSRALYRQASDAANVGDYGAAALLLFAATVALLDAQDTVIATRSATVGDLRRQLRERDAGLVGPFDAVAAAFVQRAYAERTIGEAQWTRARSAYLQLASS
jgi:hypothetical protein